MRRLPEIHPLIELMLVKAKSQGFFSLKLLTRLTNIYKLLAHIFKLLFSELTVIIKKYQLMFKQIAFH